MVSESNDGNAYNLFNALSVIRITKIFNLPMVALGIVFNLLSDIVKLKHKYFVCTKQILVQHMPDSFEGHTAGS